MKSRFFKVFGAYMDSVIVESVVIKINRVNKIEISVEALIYIIYPPNAEKRSETKIKTIPGRDVLIIPGSSVS